MKYYISFFATLSFLVLLCITHVQAATRVPACMYFQGTLMKNNQTVTQSGVTFRFKLYNASSGGTLVHDETFSGITVSSGNFGLNICETPAGTINGGVSVYTSSTGFDQSLYYLIDVNDGFTAETLTLSGGLAAAITTTPYSERANRSYGLVSLPSSSSATQAGGGIFYNNVDGYVYYYNTTLSTPAWVPLSTATSSFLNGGNTFALPIIFGTNDAQDLLFETNNNTRLTVTSGGNVGVGTNTPTEKLEVAGTIAPAANSTFDLGSVTKQFNKIYVGQNGIYLNGTQLHESSGELVWDGSLSLAGPLSVGGYTKVSLPVAGEKERLAMVTGGDVLGLWKDNGNTWVNQNFDTVNVKDHGAFADGTSHQITQANITAHPEWHGYDVYTPVSGQTLTGCSITLATQALACPSASFSQTDVGKVMTVSGAGLNGSTLYTWVESVTSATTLTTRNLAKTTSTSASVEYSSGLAISTVPYQVGHEWDFVALNEAKYVSFYANTTTPNGPSSAWKNRKMFIPSGSYMLNDTVLFKGLVGSNIEGSGRFATVIKQNEKNKPSFYFDGLAYARLENIYFEQNGGVTNNQAILEIDWTGAYTSLKPQQISLSDIEVHGQNVGDYGLRIAKSGGAAQGDTILISNLFAGYIKKECVALGSSEGIAFNALSVTFSGGNFQGCPKYGLAVHGGTVISYGTSFQNGIEAQTGSDVKIFAGANDTSAFYNIRTESARFIDSALSQRVVVDALYQNLAVSTWAAGATMNTNSMWIGTPVNGNGTVYRVVQSGTFGPTEPTWTQHTVNYGSMTAGSNTLTLAQNVMTIADVGKYIEVEGAGTFGTSQNLITTITGVSGTTVTLADSATTTVTTAKVSWGGFVTSGTALLSQYNFVTIASGNIDLRSSRVQGGQVYSGAVGFDQNTFTHNEFTRQDWLYRSDSNGTTLGGFLSNNIVKNWGDSGNPSTYLSPSSPGINQSFGQVSAVSFTDIGSGALIATAGSGGLTYNAVGLQRGDGVATTSGSASDVSRNVLGVIGTLGKIAPTTANANGSDFYLQGGLSTGTGSAGKIIFMTGVSGASGSSVNEGRAVGAFDQNARFGVGTTTPTSTLHVLSSSGSSNAVATFGTSAGDFQVFQVGSSPESVITGSVGDLAVDTVGGSMYIKSSGNNSTTGWVSLQGGGSSDFTNGGNTTGAGLILGTNDAQPLVLETNNTSRVFISSAGSVGIGTSSPAYMLDVAGSVRGVIYDQGGASYNAKAYGVTGDGTTDDYAALNTLVNTTLSSSGGTVVLPAGTYVVGTNLTIPSNITLKFEAGALLKPSTGITVIVAGDIQAPVKQIFTNAWSSQGAVSIVSYQVGKVYPEWWGASPSATDTTNTSALQAAIIGAFGNSRTNASGQSVYNRTLFFSGMYSINDELKVYHMIGFRWEGGSRLASGIKQNGANKRIIDGQSVAYGEFNNLRFEASNTQTSNPLVELDYDGSQGSDLRIQNITFNECFLNGNNIAYMGVLIAETSGAQGDNVRFVNCYGQGFTQAVAQLGGGANGNPTSLAYNALHVRWIGGDIQGNPQYGLASYGGNWIVEGTTFENGAASQNSTGADVMCYSALRGCVLENTLHESLRIAASDDMTLKNVRHQGSPNMWYLAGTSDLANSASYTNQLITGSGVGGDGKIYKVTTPGTFGGLSITSATSGTTATITSSSANWTTNAFVGYRASIVSGTGKYQYGVITANTSNTITVSSWVTDFAEVLITTPDSTSQFVVEPNWGTQVTSGTTTFALVDAKILDGPPNLGYRGNYNIDGFYTSYGGVLFVKGLLKNISSPRQDWLGPITSGTGLDDTEVLQRWENITVNRSGQTKNLPWYVPRNGATQTTDVSQSQMGTQKIVFSAGQTGGGVAFSDLWIGRGDGVAYNDANALSRNILAIQGTLGRKTPFGIDQAGSDLNIQGGLSTGSGAAGAINFYTGSSGSSGSSANAGSLRMTLSASGNLGIGTSAPSNTLQVVGSLCVKATSGSCSGATAGSIYASNTTVQSADLAENYVSSELLEPGDIVTIAQDGNAQAIKKLTVNSNQLTGKTNQALGIVSTNPGVTLNSDAQTDVVHPNLYPVALSGRVPVKVTDENGPILAGDYLTASKNFAGYAMRLKGAGQSLGRALEDMTVNSNQLTGNSTNQNIQTSKIMAFVQNSYYVPTATEIIQDARDRANELQALAANWNEIMTSDASTFDSLVVMDNLFVGKNIYVAGDIEVKGRVKAASFCIEDLCIDRSDIQLLKSIKSGQTSVQPQSSSGGQVVSGSQHTPTPPTTTSDNTSGSSDNVTDDTISTPGNTTDSSEAP